MSTICLTRAEAHENRLIALSIGNPRYMGGPCKRGHEGLRYTGNGSCVICDRIRARHRMRAKYQTDPEFLAKTKAATDFARKSRWARLQRR